VAGDQLAVVVGIGTNVVAAPEARHIPRPRWHDWELILGRKNCSACYRLLGRVSQPVGLRARVWRNTAVVAGPSRRAGAGGLGRHWRITVAGIFETIDDGGCMVVATSGGTRVPISAGEVYFGSAASVGAA